MAEGFLHEGIVSIDRPGWSSYIPKEFIPVLIAFCVSYNFPLVLSRHRVQ